MYNLHGLINSFLLQHTRTACKNAGDRSDRSANLFRQFAFILLLLIRKKYYYLYPISVRGKTTPFYCIFIRFRIQINIKINVKLFLLTMFAVFKYIYLVVLFQVFTCMVACTDFTQPCAQCSTATSCCTVRPCAPLWLTFRLALFVFRKFVFSYVFCF